MAIGLNQQLKLILLLAAFLPIKQLVAQDDYALEPWLIEPSAFFASVPESDKYFELPFSGVSLDVLSNLKQQYLGVPYKYGGTGKAGLDCSGFIQKFGAAVGVNLPHSSKMIAQFGEEIGIDNLKPGDLLFFTGRNKNSQHVGHVGIVFSIENGQIHMIHAAVTGGVRIDEPFAINYYKERFLFSKRLSY